MSDVTRAHDDRLAALQGEYAEYRARAKPRERVPDALRVATLVLIDSGVRLRAVLDACRLQHHQIARWRVQRDGSPASPAPRVLKVVDAPSAPDAAARVTIEGRRIVIELPL